MPTLNGRIEIKDESTDFTAGDEMRVGVEIAIPDKQYNWREQMIFYGKINDGNFSTAVVGKKNGNDLTSYSGWVRNRRYSDTIVRNSWESGITIHDSMINPENKSASITFSRPLIIQWP